MIANNNGSIKIFVAMPGTDMGASAIWKDSEQIKKHFYEKIREELLKLVDCSVEVVIEKDKHLGGLIHSSMFREAWDADVYIADLTGSNPNVYLELGVRWALRDNVTIVVSQNVHEIKFNAAANRAIPYSSDLDTLTKAVHKVVQAIIEGRSKREHIDSPVRLDRQILAVSNVELQAYKDTIRRLEEKVVDLEIKQGIDYLTAGRESTDSKFRIKMFRQAIQTNEALIEAYLELGIELRKVSNYDEAISVFQSGIARRPELASLHRELGITYNKYEQLDQAKSSLLEAVKRNKQDAEALSNLGGVLRRLGIKTSSAECDWAILREARDCYAQAAELQSYDHYPLGNLARLDLILSKVEPDHKAAAIEEFRALRDLCNFQLRKTPNDEWLKFDLADTYLLSGEVDDGYRLYKEAVRLLPSLHRRAVLTSVIAPLKDLLVVEVVDEQVKVTIQNVIEELSQFIAR